MSEGTFLTDYESDQEIEEVENFPPKIQKSQIKIKRKAKVSNFEKLFENERDVNLEDIKSSGWSKKRLHPTDNRLKQYFYCNIDRVNCKLDAFLFYNNSTERNIEDAMRIHQVDKDLRPQLLNDIRRLQICKTKENFNNGALLFFKTWDSKAEKFMTYFKKVPKVLNECFYL